MGDGDFSKLSSNIFLILEEDRNVKIIKDAAVRSTTSAAVRKRRQVGRLIKEGFFPQH
jgi:hypothetical protein